MATFAESRLSFNEFDKASIYFYFLVALCVRIIHDFENAYSTVQPFLCTRNVRNIRLKIICKKMVCFKFASNQKTNIRTPLVIAVTSGYSGS